MTHKQNTSKKTTRKKEKQELYAAQIRTCSMRDHAKPSPPSMVLRMAVACATESD